MQVLKCGLFHTDKIAELLPTLSELVQSENWVAVKKAAIKLKYLQSIDKAAEGWPSQVHDH